MDYPKSPHNPGVDKEKTTQEKIIVPTVKIATGVDIGAGNKLYIRGSGGGLSWEKGLPMKRLKNSWTWQGKSGESFEYKLLINDEIWCTGENYSADISQENTVTPTFE
jgi:hypothetical protein